MENRARMKKDGRVGYPLRLSRRLKEDLEDEAKKAHRSLNQEICVRLERSLRGPRTHL